MPFVLSRRRLLLFALLAASALTLGLIAKPDPVLSLHARAAAATSTATDLRRPSWFGMRLAPGHVTFTAGPIAAAPPQTNALGGILVDVDTGEILWQDNAHRELPPASTTKILTALVALENFSPAEPVAITADALHQAWDESRMGLKAGEVLSAQELLTGMLLVSGNDAATALAVDTVGPERFVAAMNAQVAALGLHDSHFTTPVGLDAPGQYSSAYDLAVISATAVRLFPLFREIVALRSADLPAGPEHPEFFLQSIDQLLAMYPFAVGIKPGWTGGAGYCEVGMAVRGGHRLISVLLGAPYSFSQSRRLLDWGFVEEGLPTTLPTPKAAAPTAHG